VSRVLRIVITGGSGQIGKLLASHFHGQGQQVVVVARSVQPAPWQVIGWDGSTLGDWASTLEGTDVVINLAGRSVNCRYTAANRSAIKASRVHTTHLLGKAISKLANPPRLWMNASTATIYRHSQDLPMDEETGEIGGSERDVPSTCAL
jgi:uncharacterized protein